MRLLEASTRIVPAEHTVTVDGKAVARPTRRLVFIMHKPRGYVSTVSDEEGRPTVMDLMRSITRNHRLFPVGRLDFNTTGALLITTQTRRISTPRGLAITGEDAGALPAAGPPGGPGLEPFALVRLDG